LKNVTHRFLTAAVAAGPAVGWPVGDGEGLLDGGCVLEVPPEQAARPRQAAAHQAAATRRAADVKRRVMA